jgi:hypothetical protein
MRLAPSDAQLSFVAEVDLSLKREKFNPKWPNSPPKGVINRGPNSPRNGPKWPNFKIILAKAVRSSNEPTTGIIYFCCGILLQGIAPATAACDDRPLLVTAACDGRPLSVTAAC